MLETILQEIRDELKRSNDLKEKQLKDFTDISEEPAGWTKLPTEEAAQDEKAPKRKTEQSADTESAGKDAAEHQQEPTEATPTEAEMKKEVAKIIKGTDNEKKTKLKTKINELGAKKVSDIQPEQRQAIIDYVAELENA